MSESIYSIYKITNLINQKVYIGYTSKTPERRFYEHVCGSHGCGRSVLHKALRKYGTEEFVLETVCQSKDAKYTENELEPYFIKKFNSHYLEGYGYNMTYGGHSVYGHKHSKKDKEKISMAAKRLWADPEYRQKMLARPKHKLKEHQKQILIECNKSRKWTTEQRNVVSERNKKLYSIPENNPMYGRKHSAETRAKISAAVKRATTEEKILKHTKQWKITAPSGEILTITNLKRFCKKNGLFYTTMQDVANGRCRPHHKGFQCIRLTDENKTQQEERLDPHNISDIAV